MTTDLTSAIPSQAAPTTVDVAASAAGTVLGLPIGGAGDVPAAIGLSRAQLVAAGFDAKVGATLVVPEPGGSLTVAVGLGDPAMLTTEGLRSAAAAYARAAASHAELAFRLEGISGLGLGAASQAVVEGILLARYRYEVLRSTPKGTALTRVTLETPPGATREEVDEIAAGAARGHAFATANLLARDLATTPHSHLNATKMADLAVELGRTHGFEVEVFDEDALVQLGCGGILSINAGSAEPPRMIKVVYRPEGTPTGRLAMVGKGVMYDSGGISLKPSDRVHAQMKNDMSGAAAVLASMTALRGLGCTTMVTGYLMCTDNMPSGTATALGDVVTVRGGTTFEMIDTDAEGRVIMADALVLATEEPNDAVVDIATLTGSVLRFLGTDMAGVFANDDAMLAQVQAAAAAVDEPVWHLPLHRPYRKHLDSTVADLTNCAPLGLPDGILAALFLAEFVGDRPWAHIDICGVAQNDAERAWYAPGCTGWGTRLLIELAMSFTPPARS